MSTQQKQAKPGISVTAKDADRDEISRQIESFFANGGEINHIHSEQCEKYVARAYAE